jgi:hypothetical protein
MVIFLHKVVKLPDFIDDYILDNIRYNVNFFEIEYKFKFQHAPVAIGLPISFYSYSRDKLLNRGYFEICPRAYFTAFRGSNWIEMNFVPKIHIIAMGTILLYPGFNVGLGLSNNLDQWAIRPEIGWDGFFSYGIALSMNPGTLFKPVRKKE